MAESMQIKRRGGRGISWTRQETLDLISLWGEEKVQEQLRDCHRNINVFEKIAEKMQEKSHDRTAEECRTKSKALRKQYREVTDHISQNGGGTVTMPFFEQLHAILGGDATIHPKHVVWSATIPHVPVGQAPSIQPVLASTHDKDLQDLFGAEQGHADLTHTLDEETVVTLCPVDPEPNPPSVSLAETSIPCSTLASETREPDSGYELMWSSGAPEHDVSVANHKTIISPAERLAEHRRRRERRTARDNVDRLIDHGTEQMNRLLTHLREEGKEYFAFRKREEERQRIEEERTSRDRERITNCIEMQTALLDKLVQYITCQDKAEKGNVQEKRQPSSHSEIVADGLSENDVPGTSATLSQVPQLVTTTRKGVRQRKVLTPYST
ncbi:uncharacterized protein LOC121925552 isoform X2 [Sceloporus undulatus]|nr:uncharacterized protein LOC121925552 isoform X2 [Sceloporus undulatus]XP_042313760.1 uncharacterized protein LOC121925552 isoform X2 [Sceloporus undulatus]